MEENIEKENLNKPTESQSENSQNEIIPTNDTETINQNLETENMEVHHHAHNPAEPHHKKNWKSYFWEFLMLFLAVFCGFLAEYQLEHKIERDRVKEYAQLLIQDLENDISMINSTTKQCENVLISFDSISAVAYKGVSRNKVTGYFYFHSQRGTISPQVTWNDATLIQVTQSGNLRYFRNRELVNKISSYHSNQEYVRYLNIGDRERREKTLDIRNRILINHYYKDYSKVLPLDSLPFADSVMKNLIPIQATDSNLLNEYANSFENRRGYMNMILTKTYPTIITNAKELILILKKEYQLE